MHYDDIVDSFGGRIMNKHKKRIKDGVVGAIVLTIIGFILLIIYSILVHGIIPYILDNKSASIDFFMGCLTVVVIVYGIGYIADRYDLFEVE